MAPSSQMNEKNETDLATVESEDVMDSEHSEDYRKMSRKILMKLDLRVLPPLALVNKILLFDYDWALLIKLDSVVVVAGELHR